MDILKRYWDANCFLGWFNNEPDKADKCKGTLEKAQNGELIIITSALTLTEVIKIKNKPVIKPEKEDIIRNFFKQEYIVIRNVDRKVGEYARNLIWKYEFLNPKDSIHVATAILFKIQTLNTFDTDLIKLDNKIENPSLHICEPDIPYHYQKGLKNF